MVQCLWEAKVTMVCGRLALLDVCLILPITATPSPQPQLQSSRLVSDSFPKDFRFFVSNIYIYNIFTVFPPTEVVTNLRRKGLSTPVR